MNMYEDKKNILVYLAIISVICFGIMDYYSKIPKKSDVEQYLLNYDVKNICIIFDKTIKYGDRYKDVRLSAIEALVKIRNEQATDFLDKYILDYNTQDNIRKEILDKYSIFDPLYIDRKIENYKMKIMEIDKNNISEYIGIFNKLILFSNDEKSMEKITHTLYFESIDMLLNTNMTEGVIGYLQEFSKYKDESRTIKVVDNYIEQYEYVKNLNDKKFNILTRLNNISKEKDTILNKKYLPITGYITAQYDATSYWFRDAYGLTGVLKTTDTVFTSPGIFTMDVLHIGESAEGYPLFLEDTSRQYDTVKLMEFWQEEKRLKETLDNMASEVVIAENNLEYIRNLLLNLRKEEKASSEMKAGGKNNLNQEAFEVSKVLRLGMNENDINNIQLVSRRNSGECAFICNKINEFDLSDIIPNKNIKIDENEMIFMEGKGLVSIDLKFDINNYQQVKKFLLDKYGKSKYEKWMWGKGTYESESDEWNHNNIIKLFYTKNIKDSKVKDEARVVIMEKEYFYRKNKI